MTSQTVYELRSRLDRLNDGEAEGHGLTFRETLVAWREASRRLAYGLHGDALAQIDGPSRWTISAARR